MALGRANNGFAAVLDGRRSVLLGRANTFLAGVAGADSIVAAALVLEGRGFEKEKIVDFLGRSRQKFRYQLLIKAQVVRTYLWRGRST